jgi:hypothetical protein
MHGGRLAIDRDAFGWTGRYIGPSLGRSHHCGLRLQMSVEAVTATNAAKVRTALTACEYSHWRRAASKSAGATVQLLLATFIG